MDNQARESEQLEKEQEQVRLAEVQANADEVPRGEDVIHKIDSILNKYPTRQNRPDANGNPQLQAVSLTSPSTCPEHNTLIAEPTLNPQTPNPPPPNNTTNQQTPLTPSNPQTTQISETKPPPPSQFQSLIPPYHSNPTKMFDPQNPPSPLPAHLLYLSENQDSLLYSYEDLLSEA